MDNFLDETGIKRAILRQSSSRVEKSTLGFSIFIKIDFQRGSKVDGAFKTHTVPWKKVCTQGFFMYCYVVPPCNKKDFSGFFCFVGGPPMEGSHFFMESFKGM